MSVAIPAVPVEEAVAAESNEDPPITLAQFLETVPPTQTRHIQAKLEVEQVRHGENKFLRLRVSWPDIQIHCTDSDCDGMRFYRLPKGRS